MNAPVNSMMVGNVNDALQSHLSFVVEQTHLIESEVYRMRYPDLDFEDLVPVVNSGNPWIKGVTYFSMDHRGKADWINGNGKDIPVVGLGMDKHEVPVYTAGVGYSYGLEDVSQAAMLGTSLDGESAIAANRAYREMLYRVGLMGDASKGFAGLFNYPTVPVMVLPDNAAGSSKLWADKSDDEILADMNLMLTSVHATTNTIAMPNTLLMSHGRMQFLASRRLGDTNMTLLQFFLANNVYTATTGQPLRVRAKRGLETAGVGGTQRMIAYRRSPEVMKMHVPMPHRFLPVQIEGLQYTIPGIFRLGGLDIRLPKEVIYADAF